MRKFFLYFLLIILFFIPINILISQTTFKWETSDTDTINYYFTHSGSISYHSLSGVNENDIVLFGSKPDYRNLDFNLEIFKVIKLTDKARKKEIIYYDTSQIADRWRDIAHPNKKEIIVIGDSVDYLTNNGFNTKSFALLIITRDGGKTWKRNIYDSNFVFQRISMCDSNNGIIYGYDVDNIYNKKSQPDMNRYLFFTNSGWQSFKKIQLPNKYVSDIHCFSPNKFVLVHLNYLSFTNDGGITWENSEYLDDNFNIRSVDFINDSIIWVVGDTKPFLSFPNNKIYKSTNYGQKWQAIHIGNDFDLAEYQKILFADSLNGLITSNYFFYRTNNGGKTWIKEYTPFNISQPITNILISNLYYPNKNFALATLNVPITNKIIKCTNKKILQKPKFYKIYNRYYKPIDYVKIKWSSINGAIKYNLKVDSTYKDGSSKDIDFYHPIIDTTINDTSYIFTNLTYGISYNIILKAIGTNLESDWSFTNFITITSKDDLYSPDLIYPGYNEMIKSNKVTLIWTKVPTAEKYFIQVNSNVGSNNIFSGFVKDTFVTINKLQPHTFYTVMMKSYIGSYYSYQHNSFFITDEVLSVNNELINKRNNNLFIYPNPTRDKFNLTINSSLFTNAKINIYNVLGLKVKQLSTELVSGKNNIPINTFDLPKGLYFIKVKSGNQISKGMFIKN